MLRQMRDEEQKRRDEEQKKRDEEQNKRDEEREERRRMELRELAELIRGSIVDLKQEFRKEMVDLENKVGENRQEIELLRGDAKEAIQAVNERVEKNEGIIRDITRHVKEDCARITVLPTAARVQMKVPQFDGRRGARPMRYIYELEEYREIYQLTDGDMLKIIRQGMIGKAGEWFAAMQHLCEDLRAFQNMFPKQYWGEERQMGVRRALDTGRFQSNAYQTRVEYATTRISMAKELTPPIEDRNLIYLLRQHFGEEINMGIIAHNVNTLPEFLTLLDRYDEIQRKWRSILGLTEGTTD